MRVCARRRGEREEKRGRWREEGRFFDFCKAEGRECRGSDGVLSGWFGQLPIFVQSASFEFHIR